MDLFAVGQYTIFFRQILEHICIIKIFLNFCCVCRLHLELTLRLILVVLWLEFEVRHVKEGGMVHLVLLDFHRISGLMMNFQICLGPVLVCASRRKLALISVKELGQVFRDLSIAWQLLREHLQVNVETAVLLNANEILVGDRLQQETSLG